MVSDFIFRFTLAREIYQFGPFKLYFNSQRNLIFQNFEGITWKLNVPSQNICFCWLYCYSLVSTEAALQIFSLWKGVLKLCSKITRKRPCRSVISIKLQSNFIEIALQYGCSPVHLLHIFKTPFTRNTSERLSLKFWRNNLWTINICPVTK